MSLRAPLIATVSGFSFNVGADRKKQPIAIPNYVGRPLFMSAASNGVTLTIDISDIPPAAPPATPVANATRADVTIVHALTKVSFPIEGIAYRANTEIELKMRVSSDLSDAGLFVRETVPEAATDIDLTFVLIETADAAEPKLRLEWITDPISIEQAENRPSASLLPPHPMGGSTLGPMGFGTP
jgi:hypothetical protein